jgi:putative transposase
MTFRPELIDELLKDYKNVDDLMGQGGIFKQLSKALIERCLTAELDTHLDEEKSSPEAEGPKNRRNGHSKKRLKESLVNQRFKSHETGTVHLN